MSHTHAVPAGPLVMRLPGWTPGSLCGEEAAGVGAVTLIQTPVASFLEEKPAATGICFLLRERADLPRPPAG